MYLVSSRYSFIYDSNIKDLQSDIILSDTYIITVKVIAESKEIIEMIKLNINEYIIRKHL